MTISNILTLILNKNVPKFNLVQINTINNYMEIPK